MSVLLVSVKLGELIGGTDNSIGGLALLCVLVDADKEVLLLLVGISIQNDDGTVLLVNLEAQVAAFLSEPVLCHIAAVIKGNQFYGHRIIVDTCPACCLHIPYGRWLEQGGKIYDGCIEPMRNDACTDTSDNLTDKVLNQQLTVAHGI